jgi:PPK2 family polyphosphate:nucleotide phosphotransferase
MKIKKLFKKAHKFAKPFCITNGKKFRLKDIDPGDTLGFKAEDHPRAKEALAVGIEALAEMQDKLYAQDKWAVLLILQAMDAAGKDGTIKHVMSGVNPQGCQVYSFKSPSAEDLDHDFLWRCMKCLPNRGHIGIFNRSYYEETLVVRVHPEFLAKQRIPPSLVTKRIWDERFQDIRCFERYLSRNGIVVVKFFLHVSKEEQRRRFLERAEMPEKNWKFSASDMAEREHWDEYQDAYEDMIRNTATKESPWRVVVGAAIIDTLHSLDLAYPKVDQARLKEIEGVKRALMKSK